jgi:hypothetical protein
MRSVQRAHRRAPQNRDARARPPHPRDARHRRSLADDDPHPHAIWACVAGKVHRFMPRFRRPLSWHVSALYSPLGWFSWRQAVVQFLEAQKGGYDERVGRIAAAGVLQHRARRSVRSAGRAARAGLLKMRAEPYSLGQVPAGGAAAHRRRRRPGRPLEIKVKAYGRGQESWVVDYQRIYYAPGAKKPGEAEWEKLIELRDKAYHTPAARRCASPRWRSIPAISRRRFTSSAANGRASMCSRRKGSRIGASRCSAAQGTGYAHNGKVIKAA